MSKNNNKKYGLAKEREVKKILQETAVYVCRARGSFGAFDIEAFYPDYCLLVSVKATRTEFYPKSEIEKIKAIPIPSYCRKQLRVWYSPRPDLPKGEWRIYDIS